MVVAYLKRTGSVKSPNRVAVYAPRRFGIILEKILDRHERSGIAVKWNVGLSKTHLSLLSTGSTQEGAAQTYLKIVDWDEKIKSNKRR